MSSVTAGDQTSADIAIGTDYILYVVWRDDGGIKFSKSADVGATWSSEVTVVSGSGLVRPAIAVNGTGAQAYVHVVYEADAANDIYYVRSTNGGSAWDTPIALDTAAEYPNIAVSSNGDLVIVTYSETTYRDLEYRRSTDGGSTWLAEGDITTTYDNYWSSIAIYGSLWYK
ncbi:MAG: sialidase family protein [Candidatus Thermoplasmatota archaeon]|nr:sialidase family protein [Candidatus Thermoplasmatota archaeon]